MPIRITDDPQEDPNDPKQPNREPSANPQKTESKPKVGWFVAAGLLLLGLFRSPKVTLIALGVAVLGFFIFGNPKKWLGTQPQPDGAKKEAYSMGCNLDSARYDRVPVCEKLEEYNLGGQLPPKISLRAYAPARQNQGNQNSCVGWASAYAARTILYNLADRRTQNIEPFSPAYVFNQISVEECGGSYPSDALELLANQGALLLKDYPYSDEVCSNQPDTSQRARAAQFKIQGYQRLSVGGDVYDVDIQAVKQNLAQGYPVLIAMKVPESFMEGKPDFVPTEAEKSDVRAHMGHAMCAIGYDDTRNGGSIEIMNSWGDSWGDNGCIWVRYDDFQRFVRDAFALYPSETERPQVVQNTSIEIGLHVRDTGKIDRTILLSKLPTGELSSSSRLPKGTKFRIAIANKVSCYAYVLGEEIDGSSYVLFPYAKFAPYFGLQGKRMFPKNKAFLIDSLGKADHFAVIVSRAELDIEALNARINEIRKPTYREKLAEALAPRISAPKPPALSKGGAWIVADWEGEGIGYAVFELQK